MSEGRCPSCLLYELSRGDRIRAEIARTTPGYRDRKERWARFMVGVHNRHQAQLAERTLGRLEALVDVAEEDDANTATLYAAPSTCPQCGAELYRCDSDHTDGPGPRWHCRGSSAHNYAPEQLAAAGSAP